MGEFAFDVLCSHHGLTEFGTPYHIHVFIGDRSSIFDYLN